jgi:hypothetical protein
MGFQADQQYNNGVEFPDNNFIKTPEQKELGKQHG